jgi:hypothetical protein
MDTKRARLKGPFYFAIFSVAALQMVNRRKPFFNGTLMLFLTKSVFLSYDTDHLEQLV